MSFYTTMHAMSADSAPLHPWRTLMIPAAIGHMRI
jgi:hypothetical protein